MVFVFASLELAVGIYSGSSAIRADALHMWTDMLNLVISFASAWVAARYPPSDAFNYGTLRAEAVGTLACLVLIYGLAVLLIVDAVKSLVVGEAEIKSLEMMGAGVAAVVFNLVLFLYLSKTGLDGIAHSHSHGGGHGHSHGGKTKKGHERFENEQDEQGECVNLYVFSYKN